ncbi:HAD superfamily hydrolase (TIGR01509 family) [Xylanimonas ulmi]|uniref:HAD superfamily hydrolase (TIGR01509 family) n=2 Tax=Xylanimonas ulmi TaxID=228973 RepID=A0A4Q7M4G6_9MICO|nr:HAD superfamily hydrolase (TIGR01509 family) [Xylanibacterium ulmi]
MVDVDGVVVRRPEGRAWHADLEADLGIRRADLDRVFFRPHFDDVVAGRADLYERLDAVLPVLGAVSSRELVDYWFAHDAALDDQFLADLASARAGGFDAHLATVQEHHRARYLWETLGLRERFDAMHYAADVGRRKAEPEFYDVVQRRTGREPGLHCLIDDSLENVDAARAAGWRAFHWRPTSRLADVLKNLAPDQRAPGFVRFEGPAPHARGHRTGVFALANNLAHTGRLAPEDRAWWRRSNDWCNAAYPDPSTIDPLVYDRTVNPGAQAWFKATAVHLIDKTREYLGLLDRYGVAWIERHSTVPGRVVYEDDVQVVVVPDAVR